MIDQLTNADSLPVLERAFQFAGARHRVLSHNIANIDTPGFRPLDLSVESFQSELADAVDRRREAGGARGGPLEFGGTDEVQFEGDRIQIEPTPIGDNLLFHDGNDRDTERLMQGMVENFLVFRAAADLMRQQMDLLTTAITERV